MSGCKLDGCPICPHAKAAGCYGEHPAPHPSSDRIPQFEGSSRPWPTGDKPRKRMVDADLARMRAACRCKQCWPPLWAGVALLCLLLTGCQFIAYQHNDYRNYSETPKSSPPPTVFPGMFGLSPGISDLARLAGPGVVVAHSAGGARAVRFADGKPLILIDPWPPNLEVPPGVPVCYVVTGRPGRVVVQPGTKLVELTHACGLCPWAWTVGHVYACRWPESAKAASMASAHARMASAGSSAVNITRRKNPSVGSCGVAIH